MNIKNWKKFNEDSFQGRYEIDNGEVEEIKKIVADFVDRELGSEDEYGYSFRYGIDVIDVGSESIPPEGIDFTDDFRELAEDLINKLSLYATYELCELGKVRFTLCIKK